jgi:hypothetical protein
VSSCDEESPQLWHTTRGPASPRRPLIGAYKRRLLRGATAASGTSLSGGKSGGEGAPPPRPVRLGTGQRQEPARTWVGLLPAIARREHELVPELVSQLLGESGHRTQTESYTHRRAGTNGRAPSAQRDFSRELDGTLSWCRVYSKSILMRGPQRAPLPLGVSAERYRLYGHPAHICMARLCADPVGGVACWRAPRRRSGWGGRLGADPMGGVVTVCSALIDGGVFRRCAVVSRVRAESSAAPPRTSVESTVGN